MGTAFQPACELGPYLRCCLICLSACRSLGPGHGRWDGGGEHFNQNRNPLAAPWGARNASLEAPKYEHANLIVANKLVLTFRSTLFFSFLLFYGVQGCPDQGVFPVWPGGHLPLRL